jgi:hypothetical protein
MSLPFGTYGCAHTTDAANSNITRDFINRNITPRMRAFACILFGMKPKPEKVVPLEDRTPTEDQVDMKDTVPQRSDKKGTKIEDLAGTGEQDSKGG